MLLLSYRDDAVSSARLIDVLWDEDPPPTAAKALQVHVSQLRRALGPENPIVTRANGYSLDLAPGALDLERFETLVARSRNAPPEEAAEQLRTALAEFRGPPLDDAPLYGPAGGDADRLMELRLAALERRVELDLQLGRDRELTGELERLTAEHPYRERFHAQLMLALYRSGRQADALDAYRRARQALVDDLGLDPSRELQKLEGQILAQDPALDAEPQALPPVQKPAPPPEAPPLPVAGDAAARPRRGPRDRHDSPAGPRRTPAHPHRTGRHRQDPLRARARAHGRPGLHRGRPLPRARRGRRSGPRGRRDRAGARRPAGRPRAAAGDRQLRAAPRRRRRARRLPRRQPARQGWSSPAARRCGWPPSTSSRSRRCRPRPPSRSSSAAPAPSTRA